MWIKGFSYFINEQLKPHTLNNSTVVVDGQNIFYRMYQNTKLPFALGAESDRYADYLRKYLSKFVKANVKCIFIFKGGHDNKGAFDFHLKRSRTRGQEYDVRKEQKDIVRPLFVSDICFQVLDEIGFEYFVGSGDTCKDCIALAQKLSCPVIAYNVEYFVLSAQYIPERSIVLDEDNNLKCGIVSLSRVLDEFNLTEQKFSYFVMLTDQYVFEENTFTSFFKNINLPLHRRYCCTFYVNLLKWLSSQDVKKASDCIFKYISEANKQKFIEEKTKFMKTILEKRGIENKTSLYIIDKDSAEITDLDEDWFDKGVFFKYISTPYINLYRYKVVKASNSIEDEEQENAIILSIDIIKYAFDLLTNFKGGSINVTFENTAKNNSQYSFPYDPSIEKPDYEANSSVFENGWGKIKELDLFQHFLQNNVWPFNLSSLERAPEDCRLLIIATVYFARKRGAVENKSEICCILLSYVMLAVVSKHVSACDKSRLSLAGKPLIDSITDKSLVTASDCETAWFIMEQYFTTSDDELEIILDRKMIHPLVEFQYCLEQLNYLNRLCGSPYEPTKYSQTYNGTFVYKSLYYMKKSKFADGMQFMQRKLSPAPTVLAFLTGIFEIYEHIMYSMV